MKFIKFRQGKGEVYHIRFSKRIVSKLSSGPIVSHYPYCNISFAANRLGDEVYDDPPSGRLCKHCKRKFLKEHSEEELFTELL